MREIVRHLIEGMGARERLEAAEALRALIARDRADGAREGEPDRCPRCGCPSFVRRGRDGRGRQRWLCRGCARSFTASTLGPVSWSKLPPEAWEELAACMACAAPLREVARRCGVSLPTAWFMRMRACEAMAADLGPFRCGEGIAAQVDGTYVPESLSGGGGFEMPRPARRSGGVRGRGQGGGRVCVLAGENSLGDVFAQVCCRGMASQARVQRVLRGRVADGTLLVTDGHWAYSGLGAALGVSVEREAHPAGGAALNGVNCLHQRLKTFLRGMNGVSSRRLQRYLWWFCWLERARRRGGDAAAEAREANLGRAYRSTRRALFSEPRFDMGYYGEAVSKVV